MSGRGLTYSTVYGDCAWHNKLISYYIMLYFTCVNYNSLRPVQIFPGPDISDILHPPLFQTGKHDERHLSCVFARLIKSQPGVMSGHLSGQSDFN